MKTLYISKCKIAASLGAVCLFNLSGVQAAQITWGETGAFNDNSVLALAGTPANEVYGIDFGGSGFQTTANGYTFDDYATSGNMSIAGGGFGLFNAYMTGGATTGDGALDTILTFGLYGGSANTGTLNNLMVGQTYTVLALLDDTRGGAAGPSSTFTVGDGVTTSPSQLFEFANGFPSVGGYIMGTFTASATTQALTVRNGGSSQYNLVLLIKTPPPLVTPPYLVTNTLPAIYTAGVGDQIVFTAAFSNSPAVNLQWQVIANGTTNNVSTGAVSSTTNNNVVISTFTLTNLQLANAGSYYLKAINATNSAGVTYSTAAPLTVVNPIAWVQNGTFTDDSVFALAGSAGNEVYGVAFNGGLGLLTTGNGYTFDDFQAAGNMSINTSGGAFGSYAGYLDGGGTTGDGTLDTLLAFGIYGGDSNTGTLQNLTVGQTYNVIIILADTRPAGPPLNGQNPGTAFHGTDGAFVSRNQSFVYAGGTPAIGGYALGTFTAKSTNQPLSIITQTLVGNYANSQYNAILVVTGTPPALPPIYLAADTQPAPASVPAGGQIAFTAAFHNIPGVNLQWQVISTNGVTNNISVGVVNVTDNSIVMSTLTFSNLQLSASGSSYQLKAVNATNSSDVAYSTAVQLTVNPTIIWGATGTFDNNTVLALAGTTNSEVYGVDFGAGLQMTANGYTFDDYTSGNMSIAGNLDGIFGGYLTGGATTGDAAFDAILTSGGYGSSANTGTLNNLTVGQTYNVLALLDDTRGAAAGGTTFLTTDGVTSSPSQQYAFTNGSPAVGGYILGTFTATATTQAFTIQNGGDSQYNAILLAKAPAVVTAPTVNPPTVSGGNLILTGTGGTPNAAYTWLTTTNLSAPITWTTNSTGTLDGIGAFSDAIPINASQPDRFFQLRLP